MKTISFFMLIILSITRLFAQLNSTHTFSNSINQVENQTNTSLLFSQLSVSKNFVIPNQITSEILSENKFSLIAETEISNHNKPDSISEEKEMSKKRTKEISFELDKGLLNFNVYADFGYVFGPQKTHTYYDYITKDVVTDFGRRDFTSYPLYANSFGLSYAFIQAQYQYEDRLKFKLSFHTGHIVEALYGEEMNSLKMVREASVSYGFTKTITTEIGIFPSYYGAEIVLNKENFHATRAYIADFTPDYEAGIRTHFKVDSNLTIRLLILNGWQEIKDLNGKKAVGLGLSYAKANRYSIDWHLYFGDENPLNSALPHKYRYYSNLYGKVQISKNYSILPVLDVMFQEPNPGKNSYDCVIAPAISLRRKFGNFFATAARYEHIYNEDDIVPELKTNTPNGWQCDSYTLTFEYTPLPLLTFRAEGRYGWNKDAVFRTGNNSLTRYDKYIILAVSFSL